MPQSHKTKDFVRWCSDNWEQVYCVPGPCELQSQDHLFGLFQNLPKNLTILDQTAYQTKKNLMILGCPLWSGHASKMPKYTQWSEAEKYFLAFKMPNTIKNWHEDDMQFLVDRIRHSEASYGPAQKIILLTHHVPSRNYLPSLAGSEKERQIMLHDGNIGHLLSPNVIGCLSGSGGGSITGFYGKYKTFCGVNAAYQGPSMVPNHQYRPDMIASFPLDEYPPDTEVAKRAAKISLRDILPIPKVAIAYANPVLQ